ncbi:MAG: hypothetical protein LBV69_07980 [Bacteroidales bacterium]|jgi:hypothetical protein|nr:hypothetical protein [Bacteroidales bacterium]
MEDDKIINADNIFVSTKTNEIETTEINPPTFKNINEIVPPTLEIENENKKFTQFSHQIGTINSFVNNNVSENQQTNIPKLNLIKTFSIISIWTSFVSALIVVPLILGILSLVFSSIGIKLYNKNPEKYTEDSYKKILKYKKFAVTGIILSSVFFILFYFCYGLLLGYLQTNNAYDFPFGYNYGY